MLSMLPSLKFMRGRYRCTGACAGYNFWAHTSSCVEDALVSCAGSSILLLTRIRERKIAKSDFSGVVQYPSDAWYGMAEPSLRSRTDPSVSSSPKDLVHDSLHLFRASSSTSGVTEWRFNSSFGMYTWLSEARCKDMLINAW